MYATQRISKEVVAFLLKKKGFNSLTDVDEVYTPFNCYSFDCKLPLSVLLIFSHTRKVRWLCILL